MKYPNFNEERKLWRRGYKIVVGLDEVGRGPLAGPVVATAVCFKYDRNRVSIETRFRGVKDSKQLTPKKREELYKILTAHPQIKWGIGRVGEKVIDRINILEATKLAIKRAVKNLEKKFQKGLLQKSSDRTNFATSSFLLIDGNFGINLNLPLKSIIKADEKVFSVAAASILAKVTRDKMMINYHKKYPQYFFAQHKGYPTELHRKMLRKYGFCKIHRKSFKVS